MPDHKISTFGRSTGISVLRKHLSKNHIEQWVTTCDNLKIPITAKSAEEAVRIFRKEPDPTSLETERLTYSKEAFVDAIVDFIVGDDQVCNNFIFFAVYLIKMQSLNVIESPHLRKIFLLLRKELKESDIPHRTAIRNRIEKAYSDYLQRLENELSVC